MGLGLIKFQFHGLVGSEAQPANRDNPLTDRPQYQELPAEIFVSSIPSAL